ncbi:DUF429 domain-containing protein [Corallococcus exiguus]|uniref:DUF429 domain-containing protein n=1 Tax=Corallococcus exiguus TaxID=83462 RepID=UPI001471F4C2|nr:DUF429 domain-containing protein [Corallococcus exiguus]NNB92503.1 DUF429 domain-containing protein [Corallococcus exiguus]NNC01321.1 DUF429 domain-containing protein [Corallococcus exiguus]
MAWVAGVDGCKTGWVVVLHDLALNTRVARVVPDFAAVLALPEAPSVIAVDIPIGLLDIAVAGGRACEVDARQLLGSRASSVFSAPTRSAVAACRAGGDYATVSSANRGSNPGAPGLSQQAFAIVPKIDQVDAALTPKHQQVLREVHPELSFAEANGGKPMVHSKKRKAGRIERERLLARLGLATPLKLLGPRLPLGVKADDLLDACIACWSAARIASGVAAVIPASPPVDTRGLRMELWR